MSDMLQREDVAMTPLDKIRKMAEWDEGQIHKDHRIQTKLGGVLVNFEPTLHYQFISGARYQHSKLSPIIEGLLKVVEMQAEAIGECISSNWVADIPPDAAMLKINLILNKAHGATAKFLDEMGE